MEPVFKPEYLDWPENARLLGDHFIANVLKAQEPHPDLAIISQDPRNQRIKPDAFPVVVEEVGPRCELVKPGDKIVIERWQWAQHSIGEGRFVAREAEVLICHNSVPAPGVIVVDVIDEEKKPLGVILPQTLKPVVRKYVHGRIDRSAHQRFRSGWEIWFEKHETGQYRFNEKIIWRVDSMMALMVKEPAPILEVV